MKMNAQAINWSMATALAMGSMQKARADEGQFAVLKTALSCGINVPSPGKSSPYYFSKDCQTAYILPGREISMRVSKVTNASGSDEAVCRRYKNSYNRIDAFEKNNESLVGLVSKLLDMDTTNLSKDQQEAIQTRIKSVREQIEINQAAIEREKESYDNHLALSGIISVSNDQVDQVALFQAVNKLEDKEAALVYPVRFVPAVLTDSVLAVGPADSTKRIAGKTILINDFPGMVPNIPESEKQKDTKYIVMNGAASGRIGISASAYCSMKLGDPSMADSDIFQGALALNLTYKVKVQAGVKIDIETKIETKDFVRSLSNFITNGKYTRNDIVNHIVQGGLSTGLKITLDDKGEVYDLNKILENDEEEGGNPMALLASKVIANFVSRGEAKLEQLGILEKLDAIKAKEVPAAEVDVVAGHREICSSSSSWFGMVRRSHCRTEPIFVKVAVNGISEYLKNTADQSFIEERIQYETNQTTTLTHTSTFVGK